MTSEELISRFAAMVGISETELLMRLAVDDSLVRNIVNDQRANPIEPRSMIPERGPAVVSTKGNGWQDDVLLEMPLGETGQRIIEEMCDAALPHGRKAKQSP